MARHGENIRKRADGEMGSRILTGYKENGKAQYKYLYGKSYREVRKKKNNFLKQEPAWPVSAAGLVQTCSELLDEWLGFCISASEGIYVFQICFRSGEAPETGARKNPARESDNRTDRPLYLSKAYLREG